MHLTSACHNPGLRCIAKFDLCQCRRKLVWGKVHPLPAARSWHSNPGLRQAVDVTCHFINSMISQIHLRLVLIVALLIEIFSCSNLQQIKFDKVKWMTKDDIEYPFRNIMLKDLMNNYKLEGLNYVEVVKLLGEPNFSDSISFAYQVIEDYGSDIDPVYTKNFDFEFDKDSVIVSCKIVEWKK
jgi:hypothetical protein